MASSSNHMHLVGGVFVLLTMLATTSSVTVRHRHGRDNSDDNLPNTGPPPPPPVALAQRGRIKMADRPDLVTMIPQQSCYYQAWNKRLTCNCNSTDTAAFLHLKMKYYVTGRESADISAVYLQQCKELIVILDLNKVDASRFPIHFRSIMKVRIEKIHYEPLYMDRQELKLVFDNVEELMFKKVFVEDTLLLRASNVKDLHFIESNFAHIPPRGFEISNARILDIRDSVFWRVSARSIVVEKTKEVTVLKNEMTINALKVVYAKDGSYLMISCNRLLNMPISPECSRTTTTTTTTTTTRRPYVFNQDSLKENERLREEEDDDDEGIKAFLPELIGGVIGGIIIILLLIVIICILLVKRRRKDEEKPETVAEAAVCATSTPGAEIETQTEEEKPKKRQAPLPPPAEELELLGREGGDSDGDDEEETSESGPRIAPPVWLEEIQKNRIFNRQKSLLSEEGLKDLAAGKPKEEPIEEGDGLLPQQDGINGGEEVVAPPPPGYSSLAQPPPDVAAAGGGAHDGEVKESSRTESDEDIDRQQLLLMQQHLHESPDPNAKVLAVSPEAEELMHEESAL